MREQLCELALESDREEVWADPDSYAGQPFVELINFTDCDGRIGTRIAAKLSADLQAYAQAAAEFAKGLQYGDDFLENYRHFARAFELAAQSGAVGFC